VAQAVRVHRVTGERRRLDAGIGEGAQVFGMAIGAAGDQRHRMTAGAEPVSHRHAEAGTCAEDD
jgi:hypothetical protein